MTRDEILSMPAGREMDALIAEKVFGKFVHVIAGVMLLGSLLDKPKPYSTDISATWEVVEFLKSRFWSTNIVCWDFSERWVVTCEYRTGHNEPKKTLYADANSAPLAICRAALLAVMQSSPAEQGQEGGKA